MFGRQGQNSGSSNGNLIEFRAGKMNLVGKMVQPDHRKGLLYLTQSEDQLMHFCWKDRNTGKVEDDLIVFPDDFEFKRVEQCKTGRVYVLKFKSSSRRMFFWMQEPKIDKDDENCRRVNELMNNPPTAQQRSSGSDSGDLQYMLNNMSQQQLMQLFGGVGQMSGLTSLLGSMNRSGDGSSRTNPSSTPSRGTSAGAAASNLQTPDNNSSAVPRMPNAPNKGKQGGKSGGTTEISGAGINDGTTRGAGKKSSAIPLSSEFQSLFSPEAGSGRSLNIDLSTALAGSEAINQLIADPHRANMLSVHLPESDDDDESKKQQIKDTIASPQFQQALSLFSNALQSAQLGPVVSQFELTPEAVAAAYAGNLEDFVKALEKALPAGATMTKEKEASDVASEEDSSVVPKSVDKKD